MNKFRIATILCAAMVMTGLCACHTTVTINQNKDMSDVKEVPEDEIKTPEEVEKEEEVKLPELESVPFDLTLYAEDGKRKIFESYGNSYLLTDESKKDYPKLAEALEAIDENEKEHYKESIEANKKDAEEFAKEQDENGDDYSYFRYSETQLKAADERVVSMLRTENGYIGGAHPDYFYQTFNLDTKTGNDILLSDIITDAQKLKSVLIERLNSLYPDGNFFDLDESLGLFELDADTKDPDKVAYMFTMDPAGLTFYFGPYDLNSYADGSQQVELFYSDIKDILNPEFVYADFEEEGRGDLIPEEESQATGLN